MSSVFSRRDVIVVASVSCIYALGNPQEWGRVVVVLKRGEIRRRDGVLRHLVDIQYERNDIELRPGRFRVRGDTLEVMPATGETVFRVEFFGDEIDRITEVDSVTGQVLQPHEQISIYPAKPFVTPEEQMDRAIHDIEAELAERLDYLRKNDKLLEAQRLEQRCKFDLEMMREVGYCSGIENYSRHIDGRPPAPRRGR